MKKNSIKYRNNVNFVLGQFEKDQEDTGKENNVIPDQAHTVREMMERMIGTTVEVEYDADDPLAIPEMTISEVLEQDISVAKEIMDSLQSKISEKETKVPEKKEDALEAKETPEKDVEE